MVPERPHCQCLAVGQQPFPLLNGNDKGFIGQCSNHPCKQQSFLGMLLQSCFKAVAGVPVLGKRGLLLHPRHGFATRTGGQAQAALAVPWFPGSSTEVGWVLRAEGPGQSPQVDPALCQGGTTASSLLESHGNALAGDKSQGSESQLLQSLNKPLNHLCSPTQSSSLDITQHM